MLAPTQELSLEATSWQPFGLGVKHVSLVNIQTSKAIPRMARVRLAMLATNSEIDAASIAGAVSVTLVMVKSNESLGE